jgi:integrase
MSVPPRRKDDSLPRRVYESDGALYFVSDLLVDGKRRQRWHRLCSRDQPRSVVHDRLAEVLKGIEAPPPPAIADAKGSMPRLLKAFRREHLPGLAASTRVEQERQYDYIAERFADYDPPEVKPADVGEFLAEWAGKPSAARQYRSRLSTFFKWCLERKLVESNPCRDIKLRKPKKRTVTWSPAIYHQVRDALLIGKNGRPTPSGPMAQCYMDLCYLLYQRVTDVRLLREEQLAGGEIRFKPTKTVNSTGKQITIQITPAITEVLERARAIARGYRTRKEGANVVPMRKASPFLIHTRDGRPFTASGIRSALKRAMKRAGVTGFTSRDLRPSSATAAEKAGYSVRQIQVALGHTELATTDGYLRDHSSTTSEVVLELPKRP